MPGHGVADILRLRMMTIAAGHEDGIDADAPRSDPIFRIALARTPEARDPCSQSTVSRPEAVPDRRMALRPSLPCGIGRFSIGRANIPICSLN